MKHLITTVFISTLFISTPVLAGAGHDHGHGHSHGPVSADVVVGKAVKKVKQLADAKKIDASWTAAKSTGAEKKTFGKGLEWVVSFKNGKVKDTTKQNLYVFFSLDGHYIAANYTGK